MVPSVLVDATASIQMPGKDSGIIRLAIVPVASPDELEAIGPGEMMRRGEAPEIVRDDWFLYKLFTDPACMPDAWCFKGYTIIIPAIVFEDKGVRYVRGIREDHHRHRDWRIELFGLDGKFDSKFYFMKTPGLRRA